MDGQVINLQRYRKGVTVIVQFDNVTAPFLIVVNDRESGKTLYYRVYDKNKLTFNLPKHGDYVTIVCDGEPKIKDIMVTDIRKFNLKYDFNKKIVVKRNYPISDVKTVFYPEITDVVNGEKKVLNTPARFLPSRKEIQVSIAKTKDLPQPVLQFILDHEQGHYYYGREYIPDDIIQTMDFLTPLQKFEISQGFKQQYDEDEIEADRYALYKFINAGYNFSGALNSLLDNLGNDHFSTERIVSLYREIDKQHKLNEL